VRPPFHRTGSEFAISGNSHTGHVWRKASDGKWRPLTSHYFWDNNYGATIVCRNLKYGTGIRTKTRRPQNQENFDTETGYRRCAHGNKSIMQCRKHGGPNQNDKSAQAHVKCSGVYEKEYPTGEYNPHYGFIVNKDFYIISRLGSGKYIDYLGRNLVLKTQNGRSSQKWYFHQ